MSVRQHIAVITTSFPDSDPGSEAAGSFVMDFAEALAGQVDVTVIAPTRACREDQYRGNPAIRRFAVPYLPLSLLKPGNPLHWPSIIRTLRSGQDVIQQLVREKNVDHVLALWALPSGYWARNIWKRHGIPYSTWALGSDIWSLRKLPVVKNTLADVLRDSQLCFADGYQLKQDVEVISGRSCEFLASSRNLPVVKKKRISDIPPYRLAFLGRWHPNKGVDLMLESLGLLSDEDWKKIEEVRICGGGPLEETIRSASTALKNAGRRVFVGGYLDKKEAAELLAWADYLLLPSRVESIPVVFSDAMQARCPVIATPVGDLPYLLRSYNVGMLACDMTPAALTTAIRMAIETPPAIYSDDLKRASKEFNLNLATERFLQAIC